MKCDIIIPVFNQKEQTQNCIESIRVNTKCSYRLIIIDNGSEDETKNYLRGLLSLKKNKEKTHKGVRDVMLVENADNISPLKAINQGIKVSDAPYVCLINNNILVTKGWFEEMLAVAESEANIGIVSPVGNASGRTGASAPLAGQVFSTGSKCRHWVEIGNAAAYCMLIKRSVIDKIGMLDEVYGTGPYYDIDYSRRAIVSGFLCVRAESAFILLAKGNTAAENSQNEIFKRNKEILYRRWGRPLKIIWAAVSPAQAVCERIANLSLELARRGSYVELFLRGRIPAGFKFPEHTSINVFQLFRFGFFFLRLAQILKTKKADALFIDGISKKSRLLTHTAELYKTALVYNPDSEKVEELWRKKFHYQ